MSNINPEILTIIIRRFTGEISSDEDRRLEEWLNESTDNQKAYEDFCRIRKASVPEVEPHFEQKEQVLSALKDSIEADSTVSVPKSNMHSFKNTKPVQNTGFRWRLIHMSAAAAVLFAFVGIWFTYFYNTGPVEMAEVFTANGEWRFITLEDGSSVHLNCGSSLRYSENWSDSDERSVYLTGEAIFDVKEGVRPFVVYTANSSVTVKGTNFCVRSRNGETRVAVREGRVAMKRLESNIEEEVTLNSGEKSRVTRDNVVAEVEKADVNKLMSWENGAVVFEKLTLNDVAEELERVFDLRFGVGDEQLGVKTVSAYFQKRSLMEILNSVTLSLNCTYKIENGIYLFMRK